MSNHNIASDSSKLKTTTSIYDLTTTAHNSDDSQPGHPAYTTSGRKDLSSMGSRIEHPEDISQLRHPVYQEARGRFDSHKSLKRRVLHESGPSGTAVAGVQESPDQEPPKKMSRRSKESHRNPIAANIAGDRADPDGSDLESESPPMALPEYLDTMKSRLEQDGVHPSRIGRFIHIPYHIWSVDPSNDSMFPLSVMIQDANCKYSYRFSCFAVRVPYSRFYA
jgi:hypothetical protein